LHCQETGCRARSQRIDQPRDIRGTVLPVGIESHNVPGALLQCELYPGLERSALPQIDRVRDHGRAGGERNLPRGVIRTVIDDDHAMASLYQVRNNRTDDGSLIKSRNDDPNRARIQLSRLY
jgi:hypothetical protein